MKVLVTGGSGRLGGYALRELLGAGHIVSSFGRREPLVSGARFIQGDIMEAEQLLQICPGHDAILHLAAVTGLGLVTPEQMMHGNIIGTLRVLEAAVAVGVAKVVFASSAAAAGITFAKNQIIPRYFPIDEEHPCEPQDEYGLSKLLGELTCKRYSDAYGIHTICLRLGNNWYVDREGAEVAVRSGGGTVRFASVEEMWTEYQLRRQDPERGKPPGPKVLWDVTDARDTGVACRLALENDEIVHDVFQILGNEVYTVQETAQLVARYYPKVPLKTPLHDHCSLWSHERAARMLNYRPQGWRNSDLESWLEERGDPI